MLLALALQEVKEHLLRRRAEKEQVKAAAEKKRKLDEGTKAAQAANKAAKEGLRQVKLTDLTGGQRNTDVRMAFACTLRGLSMLFVCGLCLHSCSKARANAIDQIAVYDPCLLNTVYCFLCS